MSRRFVVLSFGGGLADTTGMDIAATATGLSAAALGNNIDIAVAKKTLDSQKTEGAAIVALIEKANIPDPSGKSGGQIDVSA